MTPEIDRLKAEYEDAVKAETAARQAREAARDVLKSAVREWAIADLEARGIVVGVTPVEYARNDYYGKPMWRSWEGACCVNAVYGGENGPHYRLRKLTAKGIPSHAADAVPRGNYDAVRIPAPTGGA